jgi:hypothetical protein
MKISEMTNFVSRAPWPMVVSIDRWGEKDPEIKRKIVAVDRALSMNYGDKVVKALLEELFDYVEKRYLVNRKQMESKVVMFLADNRKKSA